jgi:hypothetical protein
MKKVLVLTMVLLSFVSYGQNLVPVIRTDAFGKEYIVYKEIKEEKQKKQNDYRKYFERDNYKSSNLTNTIGVMGGFSLMSSISATYGFWGDFGKWGISYTNGAVLGNDDPTDYINGVSESYTAGSSYYNIGIHRNGVFNNENVFVGGGLQNITDITTKGFNEGMYVPYVNIGIKKEIFFGCVRGEIVISKISSIGLGWGINF